MPTTVELLKASAITPITTALQAAVAASATSASASAASATSAASAASASAAAAALIAAGLVYRGTVAGASVPATATTAGDFYVITSAGTSQGKTWAPLDLAIYKGTSGQWDLIAYASVTSSYVDPVALNAPAADYIKVGSTTNRRIECIPGAIGAIGGYPFTEVDHRIYVGTGTQAQDSYVFAWAASGTSAPVGQAWALGAYLEATTGNLIIFCTGATPATDYRKITFAGFRAAYAASWRRLTVAFATGTTAPVVYLDGVVLTGGTATTGAGTTPDWVAGSLNTTCYLRGWSWERFGRLRPGRPVNRLFAQADVDFVQSAKRLNWSDSLGGRQTYDYTANFASTDGWISVTSGTVTASGGRLIIASTLAAGLNCGAQKTPLMEEPGTYEITITAKLDSGTAGAWKIVDTGSQYGSTVGDTLNEPTFTPSGTDATYTLTFQRNLNGAVMLIPTAARDATLSVSAMTIRKIGALTDPVYLPILVLADGTPNALASLLAGMQAVTDVQRWSFSTRTHTAAIQDQQLLGGDIFTYGRPQRLESITCAQLSGGALNVQIGSASTGADIVASVSIPNATTPTDLTLASRFTTARSLFVRRVAGAGTAPFVFTISGTATARTQ